MLFVVRPMSEKVQEVIARHRDLLRAYHSLSAKSNLIELYVDFAKFVLRQEVELVLFGCGIFKCSDRWNDVVPICQNRLLSSLLKEDLRVMP